MRSDHTLRRIHQHISFDWVRDGVAGCYRRNGDVSVDPVIAMKLIFLPIYDNVPREREMIRIVPARLDYLWFLRQRKMTCLAGSSLFRPH